MRGPLGVISVLLLEAAVGGSVVLWASGVWGAVRRGFFLLTGITVALCAWGAWGTARSGIEVARATVQQDGSGVDAGTLALAGPAGDRMLTALLGFALLLTAWQIVLVIRQNAVSRLVGLAAAAAGVAVVVVVGSVPVERVGSMAALSPVARSGLVIAELVLGSLFLGSTLFGLLLGHWYLVERRLSNRFMIRSSWWYVAGVIAAVGAVALSALHPEAAATGFSPFLAIPGFSVYLAAGLVAVCALIAGFVWKLAQEGGRSIQAATGMFYLAVIMAFSAELSTKFRFF